MKPQLVELKI